MRSFALRFNSRPLLRNVVMGFLGLGVLGRSSAAAVAGGGGAIAWPNATNNICLVIYTNAAAKAVHLFNTFDLEACGERMLTSPGGEGVQYWLAASPTNGSLHSVLINGSGPRLIDTNSLSVIEQVSGDGWSYLALDASAAYRDRVSQYQRGVLYVAPDLLVLHDHVVAPAPVSFQLLLHPPADTVLDPDWKDLRLNRPQVGIQIHSPSRKVLREWERISSEADAFLPGTITMRLGPTNRLTHVDLVTVFAMSPGGIKRDAFAFKLVESNTAIGARIHRAGWPTLVGFRLDAALTNASLDGFKFTGPVGVSVYRHRQKSP